jgi:NAD-dependent dihydropyrimidine dehydrogenase PreA subunit
MQQTRKIVHIDPDKCDGCGLCVPGCAEGAIRVIDGKARLLAENLCDGLGNCLGECPRGAITIEERPAEAFDPAAVEAARAQTPPPSPCAGGCPGMATILPALNALADEPLAPNPKADTPSRLHQWPVQLALLPESGQMYHTGRLLLAADCAGFAIPDLHERLLDGATLAVACPKLDDAVAYIDKLARILANTSVHQIAIVRMHVPCCGGLERIVREAIRLSGCEVEAEVKTFDAAGELRDAQKLELH